jgi:ribonuclease P protein component
VRKQLTLGKMERLKSRKQIEQLFKEGKRISIPPYRVYYLLNALFNAQQAMFNIQLGVGVPGKVFKKAVDRNRIKRLTREAWRLQKNDAVANGLKEKLRVAGKHLDVFLIYTGKELPDFKMVKEKVGVVLKKLLEKIDENNPADT